jgi:subfamily B ATP-binding cassette protein MsbA
MISALADGISSIVRLVVYLTALMWLSWELTLASLVVVPLFWWLSKTFARYVRTVSRERVRRGGSLSAVAEEHVANVPLVQAYGRHDDAVRAFHRHSQGIADAELAASALTT